MIVYFWAYLAGTLTLINPCVLPLLPIVVATAFHSGRLGPIALAAGLTLSFTTLGVAVTAFGHLVGIDEAVINRSAALVMILFGLVLLVPRAQSLLATMASPLASGANDRLDRIRASGLAAQFMIGALLAAVWSPCIGPTLGGAIGLAASGKDLGQATFTMLFFGIGVSTVLMALAYGSRELLSTRRERLMAWMPWVTPLMGTSLVLVGAAVFFHVDRALEGWLLDVMPAWLVDLSVSV